MNAVWVHQYSSVKMKPHYKGKQENNSFYRSWTAPVKSNLKYNPKFAPVITHKKAQTLTNTYVIASVLMTILLKAVVKFLEGRLLGIRAVWHRRNNNRHSEMLYRLYIYF